ncbi:MAG: shikimate kinase [Lachnospiraceae bacterium]|jgi:shikimate kinase|nr:shikimate kinase [Lachnospiraceae bacterium]
MGRTNLILIGMPASGKSTVGVILAKVIGYDFIDTDILIQRKTGKRLAQIIADDGVEGFLEIENRVNASVEADHCVIATGGSAVYGEEAMRHFKEIGHIMYLKVSYAAIEKRLGNMKKRGVALREGQTLRDLYEERTALYEKYADTVIEEQGDAEDVVVRILNRISGREP